MYDRKLVERALIFAIEVHDEQKRKYTGEPYVMHLVEVAITVATVTDDTEIIAAALLHDTIEDTPISYTDLLVFGTRVAELVLEVTDVSKPEDGNRAKRKTLDLVHLVHASADAQTIKLADLISNTKSIAIHDKNFAKVYLKEKENLFAVLIRGDQRLMDVAKMTLDLAKVLTEEVK